MEKIKELIGFIRENQNNNKSLKSLFASQFHNKLSEFEQIQLVNKDYLLKKHCI